MSDVKTLYSSESRDLRDHNLPTVKAWQGKWIWLDDSGDGQHDYACFRTGFEIDAIPDNPVLHITAEREYAVWINGRFAGRGPALSDPRFKRYDSSAVKEWLVCGRNSIAVLVYHHCAAGSGMRLTPYQEARGLLCQLDNGYKTMVGSDENWKALRHLGWQRPGVNFDDEIGRAHV